MRKDNKGFTLVEMIIVIAILSLLSTAAFTGVNYIIMANSKKCATQVNSMLDKARMESMSKADKGALYLYRYNESNYMKFTDETSPALDSTGTKISGSQVKMYYTLSNAPSTEKEIKNNVNSTAMKIKFRKSDGGLEPVSGTNYYSKILFEKESGDVDYTITLIAITGKHILK